MIEKGNYIELIDVSNDNFKIITCVINYIKTVKDKIVYMEVEDEKTHQIHKLNNFQIGIRVLRVAKDKNFEQIINLNNFKKQKKD